MIRLAVVVAIACTGCRGAKEREPAASAVGSAAGSSSEASPAAVATPEMRAFCLRSMQQIKQCFTDDAFWDAHATTFFAAQKQPIDPERKQHWIGMYKDSFATLVTAKELEQNCDVMLEQNQLPTPRQMELVDQAREQSCAAFGGALGYVLFSEGAFHAPREGKVPSTLELSAP